MKEVVVYLAFLGLIYALPNGLYHQEYNYKSSAATFQNNELQHKTDDQGFYSKDGDLEGRVKPRVSSNSEHSEYVNPKIRDYNTVFTGGLVGDTSSYGHMRAETTYGAGRGKSYVVGSNSPGTKSGNYYDLEAEGLATADNIAGTRALYGLQRAGSGYSSDLYDAGAIGSNAYGSNAYGSSASGSRAYRSDGVYGSHYGSGTLVGSSSSYQASSTLSSISSRVENELQRELQSQLQSNLALNELEALLRRKISERLEAAIRQQYGQQSIRDGYSYTIAGGRLQPTANFQQQEYLDLRRQLENNLLQRLRLEYNRQGASHYTSTHNQNQLYNQHYVQHTTTHVPYVDYGTERPVYVVQPVAPQPTDIRYTPVPYPESITTIAHRVQTSLDERLNQLLDETQQRYFSSSSHYTGNIDSLLERLREELRRNITYQLEEQIRSQYGTQIKKDNYMYSLGPSGQHSTKYNYNANDLENLKRQIETNLLEKLNRDFTTYKTRWQSSQQSSAYRETNTGYDYTTIRAVVPLHIGPNYGNYEYSTPRYDTRPTSPSIVPLISGTKGGHRYAYSASGGYQLSGTAGRNIAELQRQLQAQLSRQIQEAIARNEVTRQSYASSGYGSAQSFDTSYQRLYDELNRNLTRQLQEFQYGASSDYGSAAHGSGFDEAQLAQLRAQLQRDLTSQLQQELKQSYSSSSSYSAHSSSSSSNHAGGAYRAERGFGNEFGQYRTGGVYPSADEDCVGDDPNVHRSLRMRRAAVEPYRSRPLGLSGATSVGYGQYGPSAGAASYGSTQYRGGYYNAPTPQTNRSPVFQGQVEDDSDLTQQVENQNFAQIEDDSDTRAHIRDYNVISSPKQDAFLGQQVDDSDLTQQTVDDDFGKIVVGNQQQIDRGQQEDNDDLTQQTENDFGSIDHNTQISQSQPNRPMNRPGNYYVSTSRLTTSTQRYPSYQLRGQVEDNSDLTQQEEDTEFGKLQTGFQSHFDQSQQPRQTNTPVQTQISELDNTDLLQQVETDGFGQLQTENQYRQTGANTPLSNTVVFKPLETPTQHKITKQLEEKLTKQIKEACDNQLLINTEQISYQRLLNELNKNISREISSLQQEDYKFSVNFDQQQTLNLQHHLERTLKAILQTSVQQVYNQRQESMGQQLENINLSQQQEENVLRNLNGANHFNEQDQVAANLNLSQQQEPIGEVSNLGTANGKTQLTEESNVGNIQSTNQQNQNYNKHQIEDNYLTLGSNPETVYRPVNYANNNDFHRREINQQNQYDQLLNSGVSPGSNLPTLKQVINQNRPSTNIHNLQSVPNPKFVDDNDLIQKQELPKQSQLEDISVTGLNLQPESPQRHPVINTQTSFSDSMPNTYTIQPNNYPDSFAHQSEIAQNGPYSQRPLSSGNIQPDATQAAYNSWQSSTPKTRPGFDSLGTPLDAQTTPSLQNQVNTIQSNNYPDSFPHHSGIAQTVLYNQRPAYGSVKPISLENIQPDDTQLGYNSWQSTTPKAKLGFDSLGIPLDTQVQNHGDINPSRGHQENNFGFTNQGQVVTSQMNREEANRQSELLLEQIRKIQQSQAQLSSTHQEAQTPNMQFSGNLNIRPDGQVKPVTGQTPIVTENMPTSNREIASPEITLSNSQLTVAKQLETEILQQLDDAIKNQHNSATSYTYAYNQLKEQLKQNLTEFIAGATEPGLSKYSEQILNNFKGAEINDLQNLLEKRCSQVLEEKLKEIYYGYSYNHSSMHSYGSYDYSHGHSGSHVINHGQMRPIENDFETVSEIQPTRPQQATAVQNVIPAYSGGVKGGRRYRPQVSVEPIVEPNAASQSQSEVSNPQQPIINPNQQVEIIEEGTTTEKPSWWKRFGSKVKESAKSLKEKVGL